MTPQIVTVTEADLPAVAAIEREVFSDPWSERSFREMLSHEAVFFVAARGDDDGVVGYVVAWFAAGEGEISNLAVAPAAWGRGIGGTLLDAALAEAARRQATDVYLEVRNSNERARRLYQSRAFEAVGRRRSYYRRPVEDAIVLRRQVRSMEA